MSRRAPRCATVTSEADVDRLEADGLISVEDGDALRDFLAFLRGEITAAEFDARSSP